jgi:hypothetical protein
MAFSTSRRCMSFHTARVIRVDIAMSALSSATHNTGHYRVRPRPVCLPSSCARSANNGPSRRSSCVLASLDLATGEARTVTNVSAYRLQQTCERSAAGCWSGFFSIAVWQMTSQERRGPDRRPSDGKIKGARCAPVGRERNEVTSAPWHNVHFRLAMCKFRKTAQNQL